MGWVPSQTRFNLIPFHSRKYAEISKELWETVDQIRGINGFQSFLQPSSFLELLWAADAGPVIVVNISASRSDAIIIARHQDRPLLVPLPDATPDQVRRLADAFAAGPNSFDKGRAIFLLRELWRIIVKPIAEMLQGPLLMVPLESPIWWCPTGDAARLPLHGAGPYRRGERGMLHLYTSSYVPNLTTLILARKSKTYDSRSRTLPPLIGPNILLVGQAETKGERPLPGTSTELQTIQTYAKHATVLDGASGSRAAVVSGLKSYSWVHLACHGHRDERQPFSSHFSLHDGSLSLLDLIKTPLPNAELAVLSACHSAGARKDLPDEYLHPAAGLLMAGFKSVVATMWALDDNVGPAFAEEFYKEMLGGADGPRGANHAAAAMRKAVVTLGGQGVSLMQRINFVHFGI